MDVFEQCPQLSTDRFHLRQVEVGDSADLLKVYSDKTAVPIFNSDNCTGDFYITEIQDIERMIEFWLYEYGKRWYVRWSIIDKASNCAVGTIELLYRTSGDFFNHMGLLRLDLRSDYENEETITELLSALLPCAYGWFSCDAITTKAPACAGRRIRALEKLGFQKSEELLYGHDGRAYGNYYIVRR